MNSDKQIELTKIRFLINIISFGEIHEKTVLLDNSHNQLLNVFRIYSNEFKFIEKNRSNIFDQWFVDHENRPADSWSTIKSVEDFVGKWAFNLYQDMSYQTNFGDKFRYKILKIKQAWSQKKHRDSNNGKKACSYMLSEEYIELLDKLCTRNRRKKNEMIEILIEDACEKLGITKKPPRM